MDDIQIISTSSKDGTEPSAKNSDSNARPKAKAKGTSSGGSGRSDSESSAKPRLYAFQYQKTPFVPDYFFRPFKEFFGVDSPFEPPNGAKTGARDSVPSSSSTTVATTTVAPVAQDVGIASSAQKSIPNAGTQPAVPTATSNPSGVATSGSMDSSRIQSEARSNSQPQLPSRVQVDVQVPAIVPSVGNIAQYQTATPNATVHPGSRVTLNPVLPQPLAILPPPNPMVPAYPNQLGHSANLPRPQTTIQHYSQASASQKSVGSSHSSNQVPPVTRAPPTVSSSVPVHQNNDNTVIAASTSSVASQGQPNSFRYSCPVCKLRFIGPEAKIVEMALTGHFSEDHLSYFPYQCRPCREALTDPARIHQPSANGTIRFGSVQKASEHVRTVHDNQQIRIEIQRDHKHEDTLAAVVKSLRNGASLPPGGGNSSGVNPAVASLQQQGGGNSPRGQCSPPPQMWYKCQCGFMSLRSQELRAHVAKLHLKSSTVSCPHCPITVYSHQGVEAIIRHMREMHPHSTARPRGGDREVSLDRAMAQMTSKVLLTPQPIQPGVLVPLPVVTSGGEKVYGHVVQPQSGSPSNTPVNTSNNTGDDEIVVLKHKPPPADKSKPDATPTTSVGPSTSTVTLQPLSLTSVAQNPAPASSNPYLDSVQQASLASSSAGTPNSSSTNSHYSLTTQTQGSWPRMNPGNPQFCPTNPQPLSTSQVQRGIRTPYLNSNGIPPFPSSKGPPGSMTIQAKACTMCRQIVTYIHHRLHVACKHLGRHLVFCPLCPHSVPWKAGEIRAHIKASHPEVSDQASTIKIIDKRAEVEQELKAFPAPSTANPSLECALCGKMIPFSFGSIKTHVLTHIGRNLIRCPHCSFGDLQSAFPVKKHMETAHPNQPGGMIDDRGKYKKELNAMRRKCFRKDSLGRYITNKASEQRTVLDGILPGENGSDETGRKRRRGELTDEDLAWNMALGSPSSKDSDSDAEAPAFGPAANQKKTLPSPTPSPPNPAQTEEAEEGERAAITTEPVPTPEPPTTHPFHCGDCDRLFKDLQVALLHGITCPKNTKSRTGKCQVVWDSRTDVNLVKLEPSEEEGKEVESEAAPVV